VRLQQGPRRSEQIRTLTPPRLCGAFKTVKDVETGNSIQQVVIFW
jgi:hypothetical protein